MPMFSAVHTASTGITSHSRSAWYYADAWSGTYCQYWHNCSFTNTLVLVTITGLTSFGAVLTASTGITSYFQPAWYGADAKCGINFIFVTRVVPCRCSVRY